MDRNFGGIIWTNHVIKRLEERGIKQGDAWSAWRRPDSTKYDSRKGVWVYQRTYGGQMLEIVAKHIGRNEWIVLSVWAKRVNQKSPKRHGILDKLKLMLFGS